MKTTTTTATNEPHFTVPVRIFCALFCLVCSLALCVRCSLHSFFPFFPFFSALVIILDVPPRVLYCNRTLRMHFEGGRLTCTVPAVSSVRVRGDRETNTKAQIYMCNTTIQLTIILSRCGRCERERWEIQDMLVDIAASESIDMHFVTTSNKIACGKYFYCSCYRAN